MLPAITIFIRIKTEKVLDFSRRLFITQKYLFVFLFLLTKKGITQTNLLLNGGFEDINTCTEYKAECGVEGWFYLSEVKAQMLPNEDSNSALFGANSYAIYTKWRGFDGFTPVIGTLLPCGLQKGHGYTFKGVISAKLHTNLVLKPGIALGEKYYVPGRPFSKTMTPAVISDIQPVPATDFFSFTYHFTAGGNERYLTFGNFITEDTTGAKKAFIGTQTVSLVLDNFELVPDDPREGPCTAFEKNKEAIYTYNYRHKEMDYPLFGKGEIAVRLETSDSSFSTRDRPPPPVVQTDTLKLGDVFFDFNKARLKPEALSMLERFFVTTAGDRAPIDSIYIEGHTDSIGTDDKNIKLSMARCESIRTWLVQHTALTLVQLPIHPFGESKPVATNSTAAGRALNRRVEMIIFRRKR